MSVVANMYEDSFIDNVISLYKENKWKEIIDNHHDSEDRNKLLWVFPSEENIKFVSDSIKDKANKIISIGCGSGLLEWILTQSLDIPVLGVEVDGAWWKCKYSPPAFIPLHFAKISLEKDDSTNAILQDQQAALLFCYFNNGPAFEDYMNRFMGSFLIIIGPGEGRHTHTNPTPFEPQLDDAWRLKSFQEVRQSKDFIAVYHKSVI